MIKIFLIIVLLSCSPVQFDSGMNDCYKKCKEENKSFIFGWDSNGKKYCECKWN